MASRLTAQEARADTEREVEIRPGKTVLIERRDLITMFLEGLLPMELLTAMQRLLDQAPTFMENPAALASVPGEDRAAVVEMLRRFACLVVIDPVLVFEPDDEPNHLPVSKLTSKELLAIWTEAHAMMGIDVTKLEAARGGPEAAEQFRPQEPGPDVPAVSSGEAVREEPEQLVDYGAAVGNFG
jgi:hypothetical protein